jgi:hypothetical protein
MKYYLIGLLLLIGNNSLYAEDFFPPQFSAKYKFYAKSLPVGQATRTLTLRKDGKWVFETVAETTGFVAFFKKIRIEERSIFTRKENKIHPLEYTYKQKGIKPRLNQLSFDWAKKQAKNTFNQQTKIIALKRGTLDRLLYQVLLMQDLKQGKRKLSYRVADKGKIKIYIPSLKGKERIETGIGKLDTIRYERHSSNSKRRTIFWCAPSLHYLPVQVEHIEKNGDVFRMVLQSVKGL